MSPQDHQLDTLVSEYIEQKIDRREFFQRAAALGLSVSAASSLVAASGAAAATHASKELKVRFEIDIANIDPAFRPAFEDEQVGNCVYENLMSFRPGTFSLVNTLAESFEPSSDGLRYRFKLKQGIPFHKGFGELTAEDVKFSFERIAGITKPNIHAVYQGDWSTLETVKVESKYAGTIILKKPFAPLLASTIPAMSGAIVSKKALQKLGKKYPTNPVGTGPYEFTQWVPKQKIVLTRFEQYGGANSHYAAKPEWDRITIVPITSDSAAETALEAGDVDFGSIPTAAVNRFSPNSKFGLYRRPSLNYAWMAMNVTDPNLKDINLRHAIRSAIDVPGIIKAAYDGKWERAYAIIPQAMGLGYWPNAPHHNRDLAAAKSAMQKTGLSKLDLTLTTLNAEAFKTAAQVIQSNLSDIGITVKIQALDSATYYAIPGNGGGGPHRQLVYAFYVTEPDPSWSFVWFTCAQMKLWNWDNWCSPKFDALYTQALRTHDRARRNRLYVEMQRLWDAESSMVWIGYPTDYYAAKRSITPSLRPDGYFYLWNFRAA